MTEDEVKKRVRNDLEMLEYSSDCVWYERLNAGTVKTEWGSWLKLCRKNTPDFVCIVINKHKNISVIFIETKKTGEKLRQGQENFKSKYSKHPDIHYFTIDDPKPFKRMILNIAYNRLDAVEFSP